VCAGSSSSRSSPCPRSVGSSGAAAGTPPETTINDYVINYDNADFWFRSDVADATFQRRLDGNVFKGCVSPRSYSGLAKGTHTFEMRAVDSAGVVDDTPANRDLWIDGAATASCAARARQRQLLRRAGDASRRVRDRRHDGHV
jgi:hypothetical protein